MQFVNDSKQTIIVTNTHYETMNETLYILQVFDSSEKQLSIKFGTKQQIKSMLFGYRYSVSGENEKALNEILFEL